MSTPGTYIPKADDERILGIDISSNQGLINFATLAQATPRVRFAIVRTGISWGYKDKLHRLNWAGLGEIGIPRSAYHVLYPKESISSQAANYKSMYPDKDYGEGPVVADVELVHNATPKELSNATDAFCKALEDASGREAYVYSRYSFVTSYMEYQRWMENRKWIMAMYIDGDKYPPIREWSSAPVVPEKLKWLPLAIIQTGDRGDGPYYGMASQKLDTDRWILGEEAFAKAFGLPASMPQPERWATAMDTWARTRGYNGPRPED